MALSVSDKVVLRTQFTVVAVGLLLLAAKFAAYFVTHSNTILTDALESVINVAAGCFALYSLYLSSKPKDKDHPYGHGKVEFLSAGFEGGLIAIAGIVIVYKSVVGFLQPRQLENLNIGMAVVIVSGAVNYVMGNMLVKAGLRNQSLVLKADGEHLKTDAYSSLGVFAGLVFIAFTGWIYADNIVAILFGGFIIYTGVKLIRKSVGGIMDEADEDIVRSIVKHLNEHRKVEWIDIHNLRIIQYGNKLHIDCHVTLPWYFTLDKAHEEMEAISQVINEKHSSQVEFFIHGDPCIPSSCKLCAIDDCKVRKEPLREVIVWNFENISRNSKHGLDTN